VEQYSQKLSEVLSERIQADWQQLNPSAEDKLNEIRESF
jgi:hypothetical protein